MASFRRTMRDSLTFMDPTLRWYDGLVAKIESLSDESRRVLLTATAELLLPAFSLGLAKGVSSANLGLCQKFLEIIWMSLKQSKADLERILSERNRLETNLERFFDESDDPDGTDERICKAADIVGYLIILGDLFMDKVDTKDATETLVSRYLQFFEDYLDLRLEADAQKAEPEPAYLPPLFETPQYEMERLRWDEWIAAAQSENAFGDAVLAEWKQRALKAAHSLRLLGG